MKVAILANKENSFVLPLAEGLNRSLHQLKVESKIFYSGLACIQDYFIESSAALSEKIKKMAAIVHIERCHRSLVFCANWYIHLTLMPQNLAEK